MSLNANQKGKRFERDVAKQLNKKFNTNVRRTPMSGGMSIKGDIIDINPDSVLFDYHWECKNQEKLNIWKALEQARSDRPMGKTPVVVFTKNFEKDYACLEFEDFMNLLLTIQQLQDEINTKKDS
jgi:Holliday junction resolvase